MKERVTLTVDEDLLRRIDSRVDGETVKNRSHAVELLLRKALQGTSPAFAVILAGGKGARLRPLTDATPKSLIDINGKPIVQYNIDLCLRYGIKDIILCVGHLKEQIKAHYGDGAKFGARITYLDEDQPLGTAGCLRPLRGVAQAPFVVMNGDELKDINLHQLFEAHLDTGARATIALTTVDDPSAYGVALLDGTRIVRFVEKPRKEDAPSKLINAGLYILAPDVLELIPSGFAMLEQDVFPKLAKAGALHGYPFAGQWFDTGTPERFEHARRDWRGFRS